MNKTTTPPLSSESPAITWSKQDMEQLCWDAGVLSNIIVHGFRKAATDAFREQGYRVATISQESEDLGNIRKLSMYSLGNQPRLGRREAKKMAMDVMKKIGVRIKPDVCHADVSGRRLVVSVMLPTWIQ